MGDALVNISKAQCRSRRGGFVTWEKDGYHSTNLNAIDEERLLLLSKNGLILDWQLIHRLESAFIGPLEAKNHTNSHLGLGQGSTLLQ
jgi:hypothetical protein